MNNFVRLHPPGEVSLARLPGDVLALTDIGGYIQSIKNQYPHKIQRNCTS